MAVGQLEGKTALVTGGSTGIGLATARRFVAEGARVYITGRRQKQLDDAARELGAAAVPIRGDVSDLAELTRVFDVVAAGAAGLDILFANAGGGEGVATIADLTPESVLRIFGTNVLGTVFTVQKALPLLNPGAGVVVTGSSSAHRGHAGFGAYSASKAAVRQFARVWAAELAPRGIRVNTIIPGPTDTPGFRGIVPDAAAAEELVKQMAAGTPLGRIADPGEIADAVLFLVTAQSSFVTGVELIVDGGQLELSA